MRKYRRLNSYFISVLLVRLLYVLEYKRVSLATKECLGFKCLAENQQKYKECCIFQCVSSSRVSVIYSTSYVPYMVIQVITMMREARPVRPSPFILNKE